MYDRKVSNLVLVCFLGLFVFMAIGVDAAPKPVEITGLKVADKSPYEIGKGGLKVGTKYYIDRDYTAKRNQQVKLLLRSPLIVRPLYGLVTIAAGTRQKKEYHPLG